MFIFTFLLQDIKATQIPVLVALFMLCTIISTMKGKIKTFPTYPL